MQSKNRFRQYMARVLLRTLFVICLTLLTTQTTFAATPSQAGVSWDYKLLGPLNSAQNPETGLTIMITGSGSFDLSLSGIIGGGSYTILDGGGSVVGSGTWTAKEFIQFTPMIPGKSPGEGGTLELEALFDGTGVGILNSIQHVVIQCSMWGDKIEPHGYPWPADFVEVGPYTIHRTGGVMFNLDQ